MTGRAVVDTLLYELEPLDWLVIAAAAVSLVVLVLELRRGRQTAPTPEGE